MPKKPSLYSPIRVPPLLHSRKNPFSGYQEYGAKWLVEHKRAVLADGLGLGKTATAILASDMARSRKTLVIAPLSVLAQWRQEVLRFGSNPYTEWSFVNYERAGRAPYDRTQYDVVIIDEATAIKSPKAKRTQSIVDLSVRTPYVFMLTGTPVRNHPADLAIPFIIAEDNDGRPILHLESVYWRFVDRFFIKSANKFGGVVIQKVMPYMKEDWEDLIRKHVLRRTKALLKLPPLTTEIVQVPWGDDQQVLDYVSAMQGVLDYGDGIKEDIANALAQTTRLRQIALDPGLCDLMGGSGKLRWLHDFINTYSVDHRILVFSTFAECVRAMYMDSPVPSLAFSGDMSASQRNRTLEKWHTDDQHRVFYISAYAGGVGLNLQEADIVVHMDLPWTPDILEQCTARAYRRGQENEVHEIILVQSDPGGGKTIDHYILRLLRRKERVANQTLAIATVLNEMLEDMRKAVPV